MKLTHQELAKKILELAGRGLPSPDGNNHRAYFKRLNLETEVSKLISEHVIQHKRRVRKPKLAIQ